MKVEVCKHFSKLVLDFPYCSITHIWYIGDVVAGTGAFMWTFRCCGNWKTMYNPLVPIFSSFKVEKKCSNSSN